MLTATDLRCEHSINPLGVEARAPRLSWRMETTSRTVRQLAYRVTVASAPERLAAGSADLWDSGRVDSDAAVLVPYAGRRLRSRSRCCWQVRIWDTTGREALSEPAFWEMGLLSPNDWKAQWITGDTPKLRHDVPASPILRKEFRLANAVRSARAYVCGLGFYELYLNGRKVGDALLHPAFTKYDARALYSVHDITPYLREGDNAVGMALGTGWYNHHARNGWECLPFPWRDECKGLIQIEVTGVDGRRSTVASDATWKWSTGPVLFDGIRNGEIYDAREEKPGWTEVACRSEDWRPVRIARPPGGVLRAQVMPPCRLMETVPPVSVREVRPGVWVYDLGRNIAGWARLTANGSAGTNVVMRYAERLGPEGDIDMSHIHYHVNEELFQKDTYILNGCGNETYEPRFAYHGFQYVQVTGLPGPASLDTIQGRFVHTDLERTGSFACSNDLFNRIQQAAVASTLGNYHGLPTDCPHREKNGWTGDAHLSAEQVLYNLDAASSYTKWLDDFADCQRPSGALPGIVPTGGYGYNWGAGPAWDSACILIPWYLYLYRGDIGVLSRHYDCIVKYIGFLNSMATDHIVAFGLGDWCAPTDVGAKPKAPAELTNTAYYHSDLRLAARIAALLGHRRDAGRFETQAMKIYAAARARFYDGRNGRLSGHSQTAIAAFLYHGLVAPDERETFKTMLLNEVAACQGHLDCGILGAKCLLNVLTDLGRADVAFRIASRQDYPGWGFWLKQGATTLWERWDGRNSRNHHMFSDISAWFYKTLAGILPDPERPGFKHVIVQPWPVGDLTWATGEIRTPYGRVRSSWRREDGRFTLAVCIPPNSSATVSLPCANAALVTESGQPAADAGGANFGGIRNGRATYLIEAGQYQFECPGAD